MLCDTLMDLLNLLILFSRASSLHQVDWLASHEEPELAVEALSVSRSHTSRTSYSYSEKTRNGSRGGRVEGGSRELGYFPVPTGFWEGLGERGYEQEGILRLFYPIIVWYCSGEANAVPYFASFSATRMWREYPSSKLAQRRTGPTPEKKKKTTA